MFARRAIGASAGLLLIPTIATAQTATESPAPLVLPPIEVITTSPLLGTGLDRDKVPGATHSFSAPDLKREGSPNLTQTLRQRLGSISLNQTQNNPFQPDLEYRGFVASPLGGTPQGLAVYQNGVRINEAFGDTVNWDVIPDRAIARANLLSSNPVFGLNALGGAVALEMKSGFSYEGAEIEGSAGFFDRRSVEGEYGVRIGDLAAYIAAGALDEDGWRDFSPSELRRLYADIGTRLDDERGELHVSFTGARNELTGNGPTPIELLDARRDAIFTYPDKTENKVAMVSVNGDYAFTDTLSLQGVAYYRRFRQRTLNGDVFEAEACDPGTSAGNLCLEDEDGPVLFNQFGAAIADFLNDDTAGALNRTSTSTHGMGASLQVTETSDLFGHGNHFVVGVAYDRAKTDFAASTEIGSLTLDRTVAGTGQIVASADGTVAPVGVEAENNYVGIYATDTFDVTPELAVTLGGRFNFAEIKLNDQIGTGLDGKHTFSRFNPAVGATYKITPGVTAYAGYAEANRAPTAAELSCADATRPCTLANFFVSDPPLKQVVTRTFEAGLRGAFDAFDDGRVAWNVGAFLSDSEDDIINVASPIQGRGFFQNAGTTRRQGIEAGASYRDGRWAGYVDYAFVEATFRDGLTLNSPNNPEAEADGTIRVQSGDHVPGVPEHRLRIGVDYALTPDWTIGGTFVYASGQYLRGDEANLTAKTDDYGIVNLHTTFRVTENFELFGVVENLFDERYATFGTFAEVDDVTFTETAVSNPRSVSPGQPFAVFAGARVRF